MIAPLTGFVSASARKRSRSIAASLAGIERSAGLLRGEAAPAPPQKRLDDRALGLRQADQYDRIVGVVIGEMEDLWLALDQHGALVDGHVRDDETVAVLL